MESGSKGLSREELFDLYYSTIEEYRFQVRLNWERARHFLVLNLGIVSAGIGLLRLTDVKDYMGFISLIFACGFCVCLLAIHTMIGGKKYYRRIIYKKTALESLIGLDRVSDLKTVIPIDLSLTTTFGMQKRNRILEDPDKYINRSYFKKGSISFNTAIVFIIIAVVDMVGFIFTLHATWIRMEETPNTEIFHIVSNDLLALLPQVF